jgi:hypothetical protein
MRVWVYGMCYVCMCVHPHLPMLWIAASSVFCSIINARRAGEGWKCSTRLVCVCVCVCMHMYAHVSAVICMCAYIC